MKLHCSENTILRSVTLSVLPILQLTLSSESELFSVTLLSDSDVAAESGGIFTPLVPLLRTAIRNEKMT